MQFRSGNLCFHDYRPVPVRKPASPAVAGSSCCIGHIEREVHGTNIDGIGIGLGFTLGLTLLGICRELLGNGSVFGLTLLPETYNILLFVLPPGAFITLGFLIAIVNKLRKA